MSGWSAGSKPYSSNTSLILPIIFSAARISPAVRSTKPRGSRAFIFSDLSAIGRTRAMRS